MEQPKTPRPFMTDEHLTDEQPDDLKMAEATEPNTADIPEAPAENWRTARRSAARNL